MSMTSRPYKRMPACTVTIRVADLDALVAALRGSEVRDAMHLAFDANGLIGSGNSGKPIQRALNALEEALRAARCEEARAGR